MTSLSEVQTRQSNRRQLWILIALFALPPIAAWLFFYNPQWLPQGRTNHGTLIEPPRAMAPLALYTEKGDVFDWEVLKDQWTLVVLADGGCDELCAQQLIKVRQVRRALGANRQRVERLLILLPDSEGEIDMPSLAGLEGTRLTLAEPTEKPAILTQFSAEQATAQKSLFLIDPRINLMMRHDLSQLTSKQVLQDLEKLLKASQSWVKGGQYGHK